MSDLLIECSLLSFCCMCSLLVCQTRAVQRISKVRQSPVDAQLLTPQAEMNHLIKLTMIDEVF